MDNLIKGITLGGIVCLSGGIANWSIYKMSSYLKKWDMHIDWMDRGNFLTLLKEYKYLNQREDNRVGIWLVVFGLSVVSIFVIPLILI